jgi:hypothetical protein
MQKRKAQPIPILVFTLLVFFATFSGCIQMQGSHDRNLPVNETNRAIAVALNDSVVTSSLTGRWAIKEVNPDAESTVHRDGKYVTLRTPNVMIETESGMVNVYVDLDTRSVVNIYKAPKRGPMPTGSVGGKNS